MANSKRQRNRIDEITEGKQGKKELCRDVLELILKKLNALDLANSKMVCCSWKFIAKYVQSCYGPHREVPFLMISPLVDGGNFSLCDIVDKRNYNVKTNMGLVYQDESCYEVGSSHGCIIYFDKNFVPFILNPLTGSKLELAQFTDGKEVFLSLLEEDVRPSMGFLSYELPPELLCKIEGKSVTQCWLRNIIARKVIMSSDPFGGDKCSVVLICFLGQLVYMDVGQVAWTFFEEEEHSDVMFHEGKLYGVMARTTSVGVWDFREGPEKLLIFEPSIPMGLWESHHIYLVKLGYRMLLVTRNVADNMDDDGNGVIGEEGYKEYDWTVQEAPPSKYRTQSFDVFEMDMEKCQWVEVKSLEGCAIFLGGSHTVCVSVSTQQQEFGSLEDNSIYFTDDSWARMYANYSGDFGGHDRGVFNIRDTKVKVCDGYGFGMMKPSPCWIVANP